MSREDNNKKQVEWYDNPNIITTGIIVWIALIVILSQSFAINNHLSALDILSSILNHNIVYLLVCGYFVALKTRVGKKYFDFFNIFLIVLHLLTAGTSVLTVFQSFGLASLLGAAIDLLVLIYLFHTFLRSTGIWKTMSLDKSPFNEISNNAYFNTIVVLAMTLLAVSLVSTTSFDGTVLALMDTIYTVLFIRYIFLYGEFLNMKKISINNSGNFDEVKEAIVDKYDLDEKFEVAKEKVSEFASDVKEGIIDIKEDITSKIKESDLDEKIDALVDNVKEKTVTIKEAFDNKTEVKNFGKPKHEITSRKKNTKKNYRKDDAKKGNK